jgi:DNA (cytosine-5)-methyltransferase 1
MRQPRIVDLFSGAGGAARGYQRAGFHVTGVDIRPQPRYAGDEFVQADALTFPLDGFDAVHASPPCQDHSALAPTIAGGLHGTGYMLGDTLRRLQASGLPYVVENVPGARRDMPGALSICGQALGLARLRRHRLFVVNFAVLVPPCACDSYPPIGVYGDLRLNDRALRVRSDGRVAMRAGIQTARDLLGCQWMNAAELSQAIPPAMTELLGGFLLDHLRAEAVAS